MPLRTGVFERERVPKTLWHYTNATGLLGIIASKEIWATDLRFLNDSKERIHFRELLSARVAERLADPNAGANSIIPLETIPPRRRDYLKEHGFDTLKAFESDIESPANTRVCVASFSEARDSLSQWRGYSYAGGYCIGINGAALEELRNAKPEVYAYANQIESGTKTVDLRKVKYLSNTSSSELDEFIDTMVVIDAAFYDPWDQDDSLNRDVISHFFDVKSPLVKDHHFEHESEWRIIVQARSEVVEGLNFRDGRSCILPYFKLKLNRDFVDEIIVGPGRNAELDVIALEDLRAAQSLKFRVSKSDIPYRNW